MCYNFPDMFQIAGFDLFELFQRITIHVLFLSEY